MPKNFLEGGGACPFSDGNLPRETLILTWLKHWSVHHVKSIALVLSSERLYKYGRVLTTVSLTTFRPPSYFPSEVSGGFACPKLPQRGGVDLTIFGPFGPENRHRRRRFRIFWQIFEKRLPNNAIKINFSKNFGFKNNFRIPSWIVQYRPYSLEMAFIAPRSG